MSVFLLTLCVHSYQKFVEIEDPIATDIESELKGFVCGALAIYFTGMSVSN